MVDFRIRTRCTIHDPRQFHEVKEQVEWTFLGRPISTKSITACKACGKSWENW